MKKARIIGVNPLFKSKFKKYLVDYKIEDDKVRIISNVGTSRVVDYTLENMTKINQTIVKNKISIAQRIDAYEKSFKERLVILLLDIFLLGSAGICVPFAFFTGNYLFFILAVVVFSLLVITTSVIAFDYYLLICEIQNLKKMTGYKLDSEFEFSGLEFPKLKSH